MFDYRALAGRFSDLTYQIDPLYYNEAQHGCDSTPADEVFETFVSQNTNIFAVIAGHVDGEFYQTSFNEAGDPVYEILRDYQSSSPLGGDGWTVVMSLDADAGTLGLETYSPWTGETREKQDQRDDLLRLIPTYSDDPASLVSGLTIDPAIAGFAEALLATPGTLTSLYALAASNDPELATLLPVIEVLAGLDEGSVAGLVEDVPFKQVNTTLLTALGTATATGTIASDLLTLSLTDTGALDLDQALPFPIDTLSADDFALLDLAFDLDGKRATAFSVPFDYDAYVPEPTTALLTLIGGPLLMHRHARRRDA
ncbi:MAG: hypothetical protein AAF593_01920 [Planctomycetota bacterium]